MNPSLSGKGNIPVNLPVLYSVLKQAGHEVRIFDFTDYSCYQVTTQDGGTGTKTSSELATLNELATKEVTYDELFFKKTEEADPAVVWKNREAFYQEYATGLLDPNSKDLLRHSDPHEDFDSICAHWKPDVVAVSCLTVDFPATIRFLTPAKKKYGFFCIFGGIHAITLPDHAIYPEIVDAICIGEGEESLLELLQRLENQEAYWNIPNLWVKQKGRIHKNRLERMTDMASLPFMDFDGFDPLHFYRPFDGKLYRMVNYEWGRGCPYRCTYCENVVLNDLYKDIRKDKKIVRRKPAEHSIRELEFLIKKYKFNFIRFWDEDFTAIGMRDLEEYAALYKERIKLPFLIYSRTESLSEKKVQLLKDMGCVTLAMGIESGSEFIRRTVLDRPLTNRTIIDKFKLAKKYGIRVSGYNIIGFPRETRERIFETIQLNRVAPITTSSCTMLEPYPATPIRILCEEDGLSKGYYPSYESANGAAQFVPKGMTKEELEGLFKTFPLYVHLPRYLFPLIELAEKNTPEGRKVFKALLKVRKENFEDKPLYDEEDTYEDKPVEFGPAQLLEEVDYADDVAKSVLHQDGSCQNTATAVQEAKASLKPPPIPDKEKSALALLGVLD